MKKNELRNIGNAIIDSFISRNSEIDKFWSIGKLYAFAESEGSLKIIIDLIQNKISTNLPPLQRNTSPANIFPLIEKYRNMLSQMMTKRAVPNGWVLEAIITIDFNSRDAVPAYRQPSPEMVPFVCRLRLIDELRGSHNFIRIGWCRPHDPLRESASARLSRDLASN